MNETGILLQLLSEDVLEDLFSKLDSLVLDNESRELDSLYIQIARERSRRIKLAETAKNLSSEMENGEFNKDLKGWTSENNQSFIENMENTAPYKSENNGIPGTEFDEKGNTNKKL